MNAPADSGIAHAGNYDVKVEQTGGSWVVQILEAGTITQHLFETREFAESFAAGQRIRLEIV